VEGTANCGSWTWGVYFELSSLLLAEEKKTLRSREESWFGRRVQEGENTTRSHIGLLGVGGKSGLYNAT